MLFKKKNRTKTQQRNSGTMSERLNHTTQQQQHEKQTNIYKN